MPDMSVIGGIAASLNAAANITKAMIGIRDETLIQEKVIELQQVLLSAQSSAIDAQSEQFALMDEIRNLKQELARLDLWETTKQKYILAEIEPGQFVYALRDDMAAGEQPHKLCANCFEKGEKSILQTETRNPGRHTVYVCHRCKTDIFSGHTGGRGEGHLPRPRR